MKKIKQTLENVEEDDYSEFRKQMIEELTDVELDQSEGSLMDLLETLVMEMYGDMEDENLQAHHDHIFGTGEEG